MRAALRYRIGAAIRSLLAPLGTLLLRLLDARLPLGAAARHIAELARAEVTTTAQKRPEARLF